MDQTITGLHGAGVIFGNFTSVIPGAFYYSYDESAIITALNEGKPVYFYSSYGSSGGYHAIVLLGGASSSDVIFYNPTPGCVQTVSLSTLSSCFGTYSGHLIFIPDEAPEGVEKCSYYNGYKGSTADSAEYVVSPVTGEVIKYGYVMRKNLEIEERISKIESGEDELNASKLDEFKNSLYQKVGFIKIRVLSNADDCARADDGSATAGTGEYAEFYDEYADAGITDHVLYIEGIELPSGLDEDATANTEKLKDYIDSNLDKCSYRTNFEVSNLLNDTKEEELKEIENKKSKANYYLYTADGKLYIKEGAVIGETYADGDETTDKDGNSIDISIETEILESTTDITGLSEDAKYYTGNYMRLIFRDTDDEVVECVEEYMEKYGEKRKASKCDFEQFAYFLGCIEEGFYDYMDKGDYYGVNDLGDGAGNTGPFGLTSAIADIVSSTWPSFRLHLSIGSIPKDEAQDAYILVLESAKEDILSKLTLEDDDPLLYALMDLSHAGPEMCADVCNAISSNPSMSDSEMVSLFERYWGSNTTFESALRRRAHNRGILATKGEFLMYQEGSEGAKVVYSSETPWSDFCDGGGTYELQFESSGIYSLEKGYDTWSP